MVGSKGFVVMRISITNFRGIKSLNIELADITMFIGPNDSGKSSALEAIYLVISAFNEFRGAFVNYSAPIYLLMRRDSYVDSFIFYGAKKAEIKLRYDSSEYTLQLSTRVDMLDIPDNMRNELINFTHQITEKSIEAERGYSFLAQFFSNLFRLAAISEVGQLPAIPIYPRVPVAPIPLSRTNLYGVFGGDHRQSS